MRSNCKVGFASVGIAHDLKAPFRGPLAAVHGTHLPCRFTKCFSRWRETGTRAPKGPNLGGFRAQRWNEFSVVPGFLQLVSMYLHCSDVNLLAPHTPPSKRSLIPACPQIRARPIMSRVHDRQAVLDALRDLCKWEAIPGHVLACISAGLPPAQPQPADAVRCAPANEHAALQADAQAEGGEGAAAQATAAIVVPAPPDELLQLWQHLAGCVPTEWRVERVALSKVVQPALNAQVCARAESQRSVEMCSVYG